MVSSSQDIASCVIGRRMEDSENPSYYLSAGVYNGLQWFLNDSSYSSEVDVLLRQQSEGSNKVRMRINACKSLMTLK